MFAPVSTPKAPLALKARKAISYPSLGLLIMATLIPSVHAGLPELPHRTGVLPEPQRSFVIPNGVDFQFCADTILLVPREEDRTGAKLLADDLRRLAGWEIRIIADTDSGVDGPHVLITRADVRADTLREQNLREWVGPTREEGYRMFVDGNRLVIEGHDTRGAFYGVQTLRQLLRADFSVPSLAILDWPDMPWRISYGSFGGGAAPPPAAN